MDQTVYQILEVIWNITFLILAGCKCHQNLTAELCVERAPKRPVERGRCARLRMYCTTVNINLLHLHAPICCSPVTTQCRYDTVPISVWRVRCMRSTECLLVITYIVIFSQKFSDELQSDRADVTGVTSMSKSLPNVSIDRRMATSNTAGCVHATDQRRGRNGQQRGVSARLARPQLSLSSASSCSSGEFIPRVHPPVPHVPERPASKQDSDSWVEHSTLTRHKLQSMSREQLLRLLSRQRDEISLRESELSDLSSGMKLMLMLTVRADVTGGPTGRALDLRWSSMQILLGTKLRNNFGQVVHTYVLLLSSSITWYRPRGGDALRLGR